MSVGSIPDTYTNGETANTRTPVRAHLKEASCEGAILGKAIYENKIELKSLMNFIEK